MLLAEMAKVASLEAGPLKCYINRLERFIERHLRNGSTNKIAGNSLFSSEIILNLYTNTRGPGRNLESKRLCITVSNCLSPSRV